MLRLDSVRKTFNPGTANEVRALGGVTLEFASGSFTVVIGTNGSGKSTLQAAISGAFELDAGTVSVDGIAITRWPEYRRAHLIGRVFQDPFAGTAPELTVAENLALASKRGQWRTLTPLLRGAKRGVWRDLLSRIGLGLEDRLDDPIGLLSGGQRQSITLLMATLTNPKVLLLDEHTAALDPRSAELVIRLTTSLVAESASKARCTTIMVTHSMQQAATLGDRLIAMHRGRVYLDVSGAEKKKLTETELLGLFSQMRRDDRFDDEACALVMNQYR
ncbi:MAG: ATP-binding cassette domain-containing protein [Planctomycetota bacterium]|jgi:putative ABC transport system ATP-binding protein|nr:MAG: ATP-binding cassette domain-containing protein [Planctomycetota bacterium]